MTPEELEKRLRDGAVIAVDSNAAWSSRRWLELANAVNIVNSEAGTTLLRLVVPSLVHGEHLIREHERFGQTFNLAVVAKTLADKNVEVIGYEREDAEQYAALIFARYPTSEERHDARWRRLGIEPLHKRCLATTDWHIASQAEARQWICVTDDQGPEFQDVTLRVTLKEMQSALDSMMQSR